MNICNPFSKEYYACKNLLRTIKEKDDVVNGIAIPRTKTIEKVKASTVAVFIVIASVAVAVPTFVIGGVVLFRVLVGRLVYKGHVKTADKLRYHNDTKNETSLNNVSQFIPSNNPDWSVDFNINTVYKGEKYQYKLTKKITDMPLPVNIHGFLNCDKIVKTCEKVTLYQGSVQEGLYQGNGREVLKNGDTYQGEFNKGFRHGQGTYTCKNGFVYNCEWEKGSLKRGKEILPNGTIREGTFVNGLLHGPGFLARLHEKLQKGVFNKGLFRETKPS